MTRTLFLLLLASFVGTASPCFAGEDYMLLPQGSDTIITDMDTGKQYITRTPKEAILEISKSKRIQGFGGKMSQSTFQKPILTPTQTAESDAKKIVYMSLRDVNRVPLTGFITRPIKRFVNAVTPGIPAR